MSNIKHTTLAIDKLVYPPVGIAHITEDIADLVQYSAAGKVKINIHCASQPNSYPHLGTGMTIMTTFAIARHLRDFYHIPAEVKFEEIDNSPAEKKVVNGITYSRNLKQTKVGELSKNDLYMQVFKKLFEYLNKQSDVTYSIRSFSEYQKLPFVRAQLKKVLDNETAFIPIFGPSEKRLHLRIQCPICGFIDKAGVSVSKKKIGTDDYIITSVCFVHGPFEALLSDSPYIDTNTSLTDVIQGALFIEEDSHEKAISIMVDGNDWSGVWALNIFSRGLTALGYKYEDIPLHFYSPLITDWSGAKFSKSVYVETDAYSYLPKEMVDFSLFLNNWGEKGLDILWKEAISWALNPKKLFRDYSVAYFIKILEKGLA